MILVTGASGFVGAAVLETAAGRGMVVRAVSRSVVTPLPSGGWSSVGDLCGDNDWREVLDGVETVVHCAARVHVMVERSADPLADFRRSNVLGTLNLARQAADAGVRRMVFISSVKVNGESTHPGMPFRADDQPRPVDPYGVSKREAEQALLELGRQRDMEIVIIRPPLVYGPGVKANFAAMIKWLSRGVPLPFGAVTGNRRSLVALDNLVDLVLLCLHHPAAANRIFMVSDGEDLSTAGLLVRLARAMGRSPRLIPVPVPLLTLGASALGKQALAQRLLGNLQVDIGPTCGLLGWSPPVCIDEAMRRTVDGVRQ